MKTDVSNHFRDAFGGGGGSQIECGCCSRVHFGERGHWDWDDGEYEHLQALAAAQPETYIYHPGEDGVSWVEVDVGKAFVLGCTCGYGPRVEAFLWNARHEISEYLHHRAKEEAEETARSALGANNAREALQALDRLEDERDERAERAEKALRG